MGDKGMGNTQDAEMNLSNEQIQLAQHESAKADKLFDLTFPGMQKAFDYYSTLSSGDPDAISRAIAPAAENIEMASQAAKDRIENEMPRGGEQRLAMETSDIGAASQIGRLSTQAYTGAFPALATLAGQGIGLNINEMANAISSNAGASNTLGNVGQQQAAGKAATMGFLGSLAGAGGAVGAAAVCYIAEQLFGKDDARTHVLRFWLNHYFGKRVVGKIPMALYRRYGKAVAESLPRRPVLRAALRAVFSAAFLRARWELVGVA